MRSPRGLGSHFQGARPPLGKPRRRPPPEGGGEGGTRAVSPAPARIVRAGGELGEPLPAEPSPAGGFSAPTAAGDPAAHPGCAQRQPRLTSAGGAVRRDRPVPGGAPCPLRGSGGGGLGRCVSPPHPGGLGRFGPPPASRRAALPRSALLSRNVPPRPSAAASLPVSPLLAPPGKRIAGDPRFAHGGRDPAQGKPLLAGTRGSETPTCLWLAPSTKAVRG